MRRPSTNVLVDGHGWQLRDMFLIQMHTTALQSFRNNRGQSEAPILATDLHLIHLVLYSLLLFVTLLLLNFYIDIIWL